MALIRPTGLKSCASSRSSAPVPWRSMIMRQLASYQRQNGVSAALRDAVCVVRLDRLGRSLKVLPATVEHFKARGPLARGAPRHVLRRRRTGLACLRRNRPRRAAAYRRTHPERDCSRPCTRQTARTTTARRGEVTGSANFGPKRSVAWQRRPPARPRSINASSRTRSHREPAAAAGLAYTVGESPT